MPKERDGGHAKKPRLSKDDWTAAALSALGRGGIAAVAVEPLAARLGATKGSAYWHFPNREALLRATLERWEQEHTEAVITAVEAESDPERRLRALFHAVLSHVRRDAVELALLSSADDPLVGPVLERVTERRMSYLAKMFADLGFSRAEARRRASIAYTTYLGHTYLALTSPQRLPKSRAAMDSYIDNLAVILTTSTTSSTT
ncbi:TetR/AcrR family transcriptional regulator [Tenggerimyces flavus]|uniref:TetR/AcrR family transcriptional regulator n=1 Tax=Tenggerimyces flavus TaxID=1708749 RepID=A0ABV7YNK4_9ACTN|nr:TetR/AcrR family transcriptional regulator [Tenggerimyces flavus]MBM7790452.1 AcrR family transcriptional regulator [Tenggerimyces flavus]